MVTKFSREIDELFIDISKLGIEYSRLFKRLKEKGLTDACIERRIDEDMFRWYRIEEEFK